jgi:hypothetical protein
MLRLVLAPPPPTEYCLLWADRWLPLADPWWLCMQKAEWSGWAQAVGAIVALALAILLPVKARRDAETEAKATAMKAAAQLEHVSKEMIAACTSQNWELFQSLRHSLADACTVMQLVPFQQLHGHKLAAHFALRSAATALNSRVAIYQYGGNWQHWGAELEAFHRKVLAAIDDHARSR